MAEVSSEAPLTPLLVDGAGRDGTTLLMQLLGTSAEIAFDRNYPYEQRYFSYLLHWSQLPTREEWDEASWNLDNLAHVEELRSESTAGPLPWLERSLISADNGRLFWQEAFEPAWAAFSARARSAVRTRLGDDSLGVRYYAQKSAETWALPFERLPRLRLLCLLRDPRDVWLSSVAFHRRRVAEGDSFLPFEPGESEDDLLRRFAGEQRRRLRWLLEVEEDRRAPVIRYESLIRDLPAETERIGEWLGVRLDAEAVGRRRGEYSGHITSASAEESLGRWRREMPDEVAALFRESMGDELEALGFEA